MLSKSEPGTPGECQDDVAMTSGHRRDVIIVDKRVEVIVCAPNHVRYPRTCSSFTTRFTTSCTFHWSTQPRAIRQRGPTYRKQQEEECEGDLHESIMCL